MIVIYKKYKLRGSFDLCCLKVISKSVTHAWSDLTLSSAEIRRADKMLHEVLAYWNSQQPKTS